MARPLATHRDPCHTGVLRVIWLDYPTRHAMNTSQLLQSKRAKILQIAARHGARNVRIVGSVARGEARRASDVDFLVDMEEGRSLLDHAALILDLERLLKRPVDVASERGLRPPVRREILKDAIDL